MNTLPKVRIEAEGWRGSSAYYKWAIDTANQSNRRLRSGIKAANGRVAGAEVRMNSAEASEQVWKKTARKRGLLNVLLSVGLALLGFVAVAH